MTSAEFTGERYIRGQGGAQIAYEHVHRYAMAARWACGKRVLDVATGCGFGAALLSRFAQAVWALDIDAASLQAATAEYASDRILFLQADARRLPFPDRSLDLVLAMEVLEHVEDQELLVSEIARVTRPAGCALISTPNKAAYSDARGYRNPFHVSELYRDGFVSLLSSHFRYVHLYNQQVRAGSLIVSEGGSGAGSEILTSPAPVPGEPPAEPMYLLALCGHEAVPGPPPADSAYLDPSDSLFREHRDEAQRLNGEIERLGAWAKALESVIGERDATIASILEEVQVRDLTIERLQTEMREEIAQRDAAILKLQAEFEDRSRWALALEGEVSERDATIRRINQALDDAADHLKRIRHALLYRLLRRMRLLPD